MNTTKKLYNFEEKKEYKEYKKEILNQNCSGFYEWKKQFLKNHENQDINILVDFRAYLDKRITDLKFKKELIPNILSFIVLCITLCGIIITSFSDLHQEQSNIMQQINNIKYEQINSEIEVNAEKINDAQQSTNTHIVFSDIIILFLWILFGIFFFSSIYLIKLLFYEPKLHFLKNCAIVIDNLITTKENCIISQKSSNMKQKLFDIIKTIKSKPKYISLNTHKK